MSKTNHKDLTNMKFGKLTVIEYDKERSVNGKSYWLCKCDCGRKDLKSIQSTSLTRKNNSTKSCGCARNSSEAKEKAKMTSTSYPKDITGLKFGRLFVVEKTNEKSTSSCDNGAFLWKCLCDCGNICYYSRYKLISNYGTRSCGCLYDDSREYCKKNYCKYDIETYDYGIGYCQNGTKFIFDKEDYEKIKDYSWWYDGRYVIAHSLKNDCYTTKIIRLHRVVMNIGDREDVNVDHKNLIRYDCRKSNLRIVTNSENAMNKDYSYMVTESGVPGVRKTKSGKWNASINIDKKTVSLGTFDLIEDAIIVRKNAENVYYGEYKYNPLMYDIIELE